MKFGVKKQYFYIYIIVISLFSSFYLALFVINRMQYLNNYLERELNKYINVLEVASTLSRSLNKYQLSYFKDYATLLGDFYINNNNALDSTINDFDTYSFVAILDSSGKYEYKSNKDFNLQIDVKDILYKDSIGSLVVFDSIKQKTYIAFTYPIKDNNKVVAYVLAYLKLNILYGFNDIYLVSKNGYLLNSPKINDIDITYDNISFSYPEEWEMIMLNKDGQFVSPNGVFTYKTLDNIDSINNIKVIQNHYYLVSVIPINPNDSPYFINSISSFMKYINFRENIMYWFISYIWIFCTSIIVLMIIINKIKNSELANLDYMTGVFNRRSGYEKINKLIKEFSDSRHRIHFTYEISRLFYFRKPINSIHFCMVDIDGLKQINDKLGHKYGDELIVITVDCLKKDLHKGEILVRMGGDEFLIIFVNRNFQDINDYWNNVSQMFTEKNNSNNFKYSIKASHGVVEYIPNMDIESCIVLADEIMYKEKRRHKVNLFFN